MYTLAQLVLPTEVLRYFDVVGIDIFPSEFHIHLDEKMHPSLAEDLHFESKGFMAETSITDFPIRDHKVILKIRRRRWVDVRTGNSFSLPLDLDITAKGTRYSKEFAAF